MLNKLIKTVQNIFFEERFELSESNTHKEGYKTIPIARGAFFLLAENTTEYPTISRIKNLLEYLHVNFEQAEEEHTQFQLLLKDIKNSIALIRTHQFSIDSYIDAFKDETHLCKIVLIHNDEIVFNNGMDEFTIKASRKKLEKVQQFEIFLGDGEIFAFCESNLSIILESDTLRNRIHKLQIEFKLSWLNSIIHEQYLRHHDTLTGLKNRQRLIEDIEHIKIENIKKGATLVMINIKDFTFMNERYGHDIGDLVLQNISKMVQEHFDNYDIYRAYGDRFALIMPTKELALQYLRPFLDRMNIDTFDIIHPKLHHKVQIQLKLEASLTKISSDISTVLTDANISLNSTDKLHKDIIIFEEDVAAELSKELYWFNEISRALNEDRIIPYYQPIFDRTGINVIKYEVLMRLKQGDQIILPGKFLPYAKGAIYHFMTRRIVEKSFSMVDESTKISINISLFDIMESEFITFVIECAAQNNFSLKNLTFELLENDDLTQHIHYVTTFASEIKRHGINLSIDDFGTGYSNFKYLQTLQLNYLKIDGSLIKNIDTNPIDRKVVEGIIAFATAMNLKVIAEFVTNETIFNIINKYAIEGLQGFYLGKPAAEPRLYKK